MGNSPSNGGQRGRRGQRGQERLKSEINISVAGLDDGGAAGDVVMSKKARQSWRSTFNEGTGVSVDTGADLPNRINAGVTPRYRGLSDKRASAALGAKGADLLRLSISSAGDLGESRASLSGDAPT